MTTFTEEFEYAINLNTVITNDLIEEINNRFPHNPITKEDIKIQYMDRDWDTDSGNLSHANLYANIRIKILNKTQTEKIIQFLKEYLP